ncbi:MAG: bifunctional hydroxymethylpyrimidine kinase/phosphomethylpyrimidine kinase [Methanomassiliicoccus sp.]|nr:bifunctional hydroxymethylpyrimidine kinase/phosphomethylpyrimidine kinase [Methanomassiliicoccus sp.]
MLVALTIAGSDSIGGAGIEADIKAMASQGVHAAVAITAVTAQNTTRVAGIFPLHPREVVAQIDAVLEDARVSAVKTGMLYSADIASAVAGRLSSEDIPLVVDPVMVAGVGDALNRDDLVSALRDRLIPLATIVTPNVPEAEALVGYPVFDEATVRHACRDLSDLGAKAVMLKGGHLDSEVCVDTIYYDGKFLQVAVPRVDLRGHGGGCILSSYLTSNLAKGAGVWESALKAKEAIDEAIASRHEVGRGVPVVEPLAARMRDALRYQVACRLRAVSRQMAEELPMEWRPDTGLRMVFALPEARSTDDVCGLEPFLDGREHLSPGCPAFGAASDLGEAVLSVMRSDGSQRAAVDLRFTEENARAVRRAGLSIEVIRRRRGVSDKRATLKEDAIMPLGFVPDAMFHRGAPVKGSLIRLLAASPEELLTDLRRILG